MYLLLKCAQNAIDCFIIHADEPDTTYWFITIIVVIITIIWSKRRTYKSKAIFLQVKHENVRINVLTSVNIFVQFVWFFFSHNVVDLELNYTMKFYRLENRLIFWSLWIN